MKTYSVQFGVGDPRTYTGLSPTFLIFVNISSGATVAPPSISEALTGSGIYKFQWGTTTPIAFLADAATTSPGSQARYVTGQIDPADRADEYGTTLVAIGTSTIAFGATLNAIGTTNFALGTTSVALGISGVALGSTSVSWLSSIGSTLGAIGATQFAFGSTLVAIGTTNFSLGTSGVALGASIYALEQSIGSTVVGMGNTLSVIGQSLSVIAPGIGAVGSTFGGQNTDPVDLFGYVKRILENLEGDSQFTKVSGAWNIYNRGSTTLLRQKTVANSASLVTKTGL